MNQDIGHDLPPKLRAARIHEAALRRVSQSTEYRCARDPLDRFCIYAGGNTIAEGNAERPYPEKRDEQTLDMLRYLCEAANKYPEVVRENMRLQARIAELEAST